MLNVAPHPSPWLRRQRGKQQRKPLNHFHQVIDDVNQLTAEIEALECNVDNALLGHLEFERIVEGYHEIVARPNTLSSESLEQLLALGNRTLEDEGLVLLRRGDVLPWLQLARLDIGDWERHLIIAFVSGSEQAFYRYSPVTPHLISDDSYQKTWIDCTTVFPVSDDDDDWIGHWEQTIEREAFATTSLLLHNLLERSGLAPLAALARLACPGLMDLIEVKILADWLSLPNKMRGRRLTTMGGTAALAHLIHGASIGLETPLDAATQAAVESQVQTLVTRAQALLAPMEPSLGVANQRTLGSIQLGLLSTGVVIPSLHGQLTALDAPAAKLARRLRERLAEPRRYQPGGVPLSLPIDIADLESDGPRKLLAVLYLQEIYADFHARHLQAEYDKWMIESSGCPQPFFSDLPLEPRVKAAVGAQILGDFQSVINSTPNHLFDLSRIPIPESCHEEERKALAGMMNTLEEAIKKAVLFLWVRRALGEPVTPIFEDWLAQYESRYPYRGHGVSNLTQLLEPALFFSEPRFQHLLRHESSTYVKPWRNIRALARLMTSYINPPDNDWAALHRHVIVPMASAMIDMGLKIVSGSGELGSMTAATNALSLMNTWRKPWPNFFQRPVSFRDQRLLAVNESKQPIEVVDAPPGYPWVYEELKRRNASTIRRLAQALEASPRQPRPSIVHAQTGGPLVDPMAIRLAHTGRFWRTVHKVNRPVALHPVLALLMDFSGSMRQELVDSAKNVAVSLAEALGTRATVLFYLYTTGGIGYRLIQIMDGQAGSMSKMAALAAPETRAGSGWNPDAACLLGVLAELERVNPQGAATICHLADFELCASLAVSGLDSPEQELHYALDRVLKAGHRYIAARVGSDESDPISPAVAHDYLYLGSDNTLDPGAVTALLAILRKQWKI